MTEVAGPYCLNFTGSQIHVCGRYGKIIERYTNAQEDEAREHCHRLQAGYVSPPPKPERKPTKAQADVLRRAREGIAFRAPQLAGAFEECAALGWINADPTEYGLHVTLTAAGMAVKLS